MDGGDPFKAWLELQLRLQRETFGVDPPALSGRERAEYIRWNALAVVSELDEFLQEVQWKPWAQDEGLIMNPIRAEAELVDMLHFVGNLLLAIGAEPDSLWRAYQAKHEVNQRRQTEGYDGVTGKCANCRRDLSETGTTSADVELYEGATVAVILCAGCGAIVDSPILRKA